MVPNIKNVSMGPVPDINNGDWDWSQRAVFGIWDWSQSIIGTTNYNVGFAKFLLSPDQRREDVPSAGVEEEVRAG